MIKTILLTTSSKVLLIFSNKSKESAIFLKHLEHLVDVHKGRFVIHFLFSNNLNVYEKRLSKWLLEQLLDKYLPGKVPQAYYYLCGPWDYMMTIQITLLGLGVPKYQIIKENFDTLPSLSIRRPPDTEPHPVTIHINGKQYTFSVQYPKTILAAAREEHIELPFSCEAGRCGSCAAICTAGKVWMGYNEVLMDDELSRGLILTCQAYPQYGPVEIRF
jgi:ferredoxin